MLSQRFKMICDEVQFNFNAKFIVLKKDSRNFLLFLLSSLIETVKIAGEI